MRPNLKYPLLYYLYNLVREFESYFIKIFLDYNDSLMLTPLMFIGEFFAGLIVFLYQKKFVKKNIFGFENKDNYMNLELIKTENSVRKIDTIKKIIFLLFCCAYFDFIQFIISFSYDKFSKTSISLYVRLMGLSIIIDTFLYNYS